MGDINKDAKVGVSLASARGARENRLFKFADGEKEIPSFITDFFGGVAVLREVEERLAERPYSEFYRGYRLAVEKRRLNDFGDKVVRDHFRSRIF